MSFKATLSQTSGSGPSLTQFNSEYVIGWCGSGNNYLNFASSTDGGQNWGSATTISSQTSATAPAMVEMSGVFYIAWTGTDSDHSLNVMQSSDLKTFSSHSIIQEQMFDGSAPALAVFKDVLYVAWADSSGKLRVAQIVNGQEKNKVSVGETSYATPALAVDDNYLYLAWTGTNDVTNLASGGTANDLNVMRSSDGSKFTNKVTINATTDPYNGPGLTIDGDKLLIAWSAYDTSDGVIKTSDDVRYLRTMYSTDQGSSFGGKTTDSSNTSKKGPALCSSLIAWTGTDSKLNVEPAFSN